MFGFIRNFNTLVSSNIKAVLERFTRQKLEANDGEITIKEKYRLKPSNFTMEVPVIVFDIINIDKKVIGKIEFRIGYNEDIYLLGNIGYHVNEKYRGNNSAYKACKLLFNIAREEFKITELIITCSPENIQSFKTLEKLNGTLIEKKEVPEGHFLRRMNEFEKCIFKYNL